MRITNDTNRNIFRDHHREEKGKEVQLQSDYTICDDLRGEGIMTLKYSDFEKSINKKVYCKDCKFCQDKGHSFASCQAIKKDDYSGVSKGEFISTMKLFPDRHDFPNEYGQCEYYEPMPTLISRWWEFWRKS